MRVLGIDPGLTRCGWGVVEGRPGARPTALGVGVVVVVRRGCTTYGLGQRHRLGVEVHVVPPRERAAPVEDHRVHRHAGQPNRNLLGG